MEQEETENVVVLINGRECHWQVMSSFKKGDESSAIVCKRVCHDGFNDEGGRLERYVRIPRPETNPLIKAKLTEIFAAYKTPTKTQKAIQDLLELEHWKQKAHQKCKELTKRDQEKYTRSPITK